MNVNWLLAYSNPTRYDRLLEIEERVVPIELPETELGEFVIKKKTFEPEFKFDMTNNGGFVSYKGEVTITMLKQDGVLWMSDSPSELRDMGWLIQDSQAHGRVLVAGLGMGILTAMLMDNPEVTEIVVVELNEDVIKLIQPHLEQKKSHVKLKFVCEDIHDFVKRDPLEFNAFILDIWGDVSTDDLKPMLELYTDIRDKTGDKVGGAIWGFRLALEAMMQYVRGYTNPSDTAWRIESDYGLSEIADFINDYYPDEDYETYNEEEDEYVDEWDGLEDDAVSEALWNVYGLRA